MEHESMQIKKIIDIYDLDESLAKSLKKCIQYKDAGKVTDIYKDTLDCKGNSAFEILSDTLSASIKCLTDREKVAIMTQHTDLKGLISIVENEYYEPALKEMSEKLNVETEDIRSFIRQINRMKCKLTKELDTILLRGYLQYYNHLTSNQTKEFECGFSAIDTYKLDKYNSMQEEILSLKNKEDILIIENTETNKTATALLWSDLMQDNMKCRRIYYLLNFIDDINNLYKNIHEQGIDAAIVHSKAEEFLSQSYKDEEISSLYDLYKRSIKQLNICTTKRITRSIFSCKEYEMTLAQFKNSILILDEIHYFDIDDLAILLTTLKFLKEKLNVSICIISSNMSIDLKNLICTELDINKVVENNKATQKDIEEKINIDLEAYNKECEDLKRLLNTMRVANYSSL